jgi:aminoglycoside phosphotransferase (APT) family kinase protein
MSGLEERIAAYLAHRRPEASDIVVDELVRIHGGSSQETFRLRARWREAGQSVEQRLILRREPPSGLVVAERDLEYSVYRALEGRDVPIPRAHYLDLDPAWLDRPFFIMDMMPGKPGNPWGPGDPYDGHGDTIARQFWGILGRLAALDHRELGLTKLRNGESRDGHWANELDHWEAILDAGERIIDPAARGALRWMRRNPPPPAAKPAIVHGDYRSGNFLFTPDGRISAILDWEMCHIGDPLEDIAWALNQAWPITRHLPLEEGLAIWEAESGLKADRAALDWWRLFAAVKATAIWVTAEASFNGGKSREMVIGLTPLRVGHLHRTEILTRMAERGAMG